MHMEKGCLEVYDRNQRRILSAPLAENKTFQVQIQVANSDCLATVADSNDSWTWHLGYGHLNFQSLKKLRVKGMVTGLPLIKDPEKASENCLIGKQPRIAFTSYIQMRAKNVLEVVHSDACGPFEIPSLGGNRYFVSFVDEFSTMLWMYLIKTKDEVLSIFKRFKVMTVISQIFTL